MKCIYTLEELDVLCRQWQRVLRLQDWEVQVSIGKSDEVGERGSADGLCEWWLELKSAKITLLDPEDYTDRMDDEYDMEEVLVHELLHLHFAYFMPENRKKLEYIMAEQAVDMIAQALVATKRGDLLEEAAG